MKVGDIEKPLKKGTRLKVVFAPLAKTPEFVDDAARLVGETGTVERHVTKPFPQIYMLWDTKKPGHLMLIAEDEVEVLAGRRGGKNEASDESD